MNVLEVDFEKKLKSFSLHIQFQAEGGCIGILGASGCGKSMTFKAIAGIETPDSGKICLGKRELFHRGHKVNLPPRKRSVGYLFQSYALFPNMTVFQNIEAGIQGKKAAKRERAMEMMEKFHLSELASGYPARLSGGQQQRVALARILACEPKDYRELEFDSYKYDEFNIIASKLEEQAKTIHDTMKKLKSEQIKINGILDQMKEGFVLLDSDLTVLMVNRKAQKLYGHTIKLNCSIKDFIFDFKIINALDHLSDEQQVVEVEKEKEFYNCYVAKVDYGVTLLFVNITEQHNAMKMRQEFFSNVSHELKTPMTSIRGYSELLETGVINDKDASKKALDKIHDEVNNMSTLINDILMISRLENKDVDVIKHPVHLTPLVDEIIDTMQVEIDKKHLQVDKELEDITYTSNHQHMHQLLSNLITNAIKYNVDGGKIIIKSYQFGRNIIIEVSDTGRGISKIDQGRVFERFFRCDQGRDKETGGTGLGLAIVKHIVQYYQGNITLTSKLHEGTTFKVTLPMEEEVI